MSDTTPKIVARDEWNRAREELLVLEKAHTRAGDELAAARRRLPLTAIEPMTVVGAAGEMPLLEVFEGRTMLIVYHFMWNVGAPHHKQCPGCTHTQVAMTAAVQAYLADRDVTYVVFCSGPLDEILAYREFMGWTAPWYSTASSDRSLATRDGGDLRCYMQHDSRIFLTYETKWRGVEAMLPTLQLLDLTRFGRHEDWEEASNGIQQVPAASWWRRDDRPIAQWTRTAEPVE